MPYPEAKYENILLDRLRKDDRHAFTILFSRYYKDLVTFSLAILQDQQLAEEVVQEVFLKVWESRYSLEIQVSLRSYLLKSVQNRSIDCLRHLEIRQKYMEMAHESPGLYARDTDNYILHSELAAHLLKALNIIPEVYSEVFRMSRTEGLQYRDIAAKLGVSERTVEVRMSKALQLLRVLLKDFLS